jgi:hypothetical protein
MNGAEGQNRTADTVIFSHVLYQLSYLGTPDTPKTFDHSISSVARRTRDLDTSLHVFSAREGMS